MNSFPRVQRGHRVDISDALGLPYSLVVAKDECLVLADGTASRHAKLIALERLESWPIEKVSGIQSAVAKELISGAVERVRPRTRNAIDHSP